MESDSLFYLKNQFYLGNYKHLASNPSPSKDSPEYWGILFYTIRSHIALKDYASALALTSSSSKDDPQIRALRSLASYCRSPEDKDTYLEELRDLCIEIEEGFDGDEGDGIGSGLIKVAAATAFIKEGELEEALTTLGAGAKSRDIECVALIVQVYLSINRPDLAKKEYNAAKKWADDSVIIQLIEASIGMAMGTSTLQTAHYIYAEQVSAPGSSTNPSVLTAKAITHYLLGNYQDATKDLNEALAIDPTFESALALKVPLAELAGKKGEGEEAFRQLQSTAPDHPLVVDVLEKSEAFDEAAAKFGVPVEA